MTRIQPVSSPEVAEEALAHLTRGEVIVVPTDTVYGLAAVAESTAISKLYDLKQRPEDMAIAVLASSIESAADLITITHQVQVLADAFWPGPLTIVAHSTPTAPANLGKQTAATIGVRVPADDFIQALTASSPLAVTSANLHGQPTPPTAQEVADLFPDIPLVIDAGTLDNEASTVVDATQTPPQILRPGPLTSEDIQNIYRRKMSW